MYLHVSAVQMHIYFVVHLTDGMRPLLRRHLVMDRRVMKAGYQHAVISQGQNNYRTGPFAIWTRKPSPYPCGCVQRIRKELAHADAGVSGGEIIYCLGIDQNIWVVGREG
ncbi:hypothetical protein Zmor_019424 [Zophobas morio]|uniref:Uncharacterized protein n=1 Tax=Zophobas morio TaxID=2755281 RepID=A0AA38I1J9_9CUCU|nr:hypothetical protein Zmor_019424 [Zophobas morio]